MQAVTVSRSFTGVRTVYLRAGTFYLPSTLSLGAQDSGLTISAYNGEQVSDRMHDLPYFVADVCWLCC